MKSNILITGSSGKLGNHLLKYFIKYNDFNQNNIYALTRDESKINKYYIDKGIKIIKGDYNDIDSLINSFNGIDKILFISSSELEHRKQQHLNIVNAAIKSNIKYIAYTSFIRSNDNNLNTHPIKFILDSVLYTEMLIKQSGIPFTFFINGLYSEGLTEYFFKDALSNHDDELLFPAGNGIVNYTTRDDIAEGLVKVMLNTTNDYIGKSLSFNSEHQYNLYNVASIISKVTNQNIKYIDTSIDTYSSILKNKYGIDEYFINFNIGFAQAIKIGNFNTTKSDLKNIINRDTTTLEQYLTNYFKQETNK